MGRVTGGFLQTLWQGGKVKDQGVKYISDARWISMGQNESATFLGWLTLKELEPFPKKS